MAFKLSLVTDRKFVYKKRIFKRGIDYIRDIFDIDTTKLIIEKARDIQNASRIDCPVRLMIYLIIVSIGFGRG